MRDCRGGSEASQNRMFVQIQADSRGLWHPKKKMHLPLGWHWVDFLA